MAKPSLTFVSAAFVFLSVISTSLSVPVPTVTTPPLDEKTFSECLTQNINSTTPLTQIFFANTNPQFTTVLRNYIHNARFNLTGTPKPLFIIIALEESHVRAAVICAKTANVQLKIRSGGHDYDGLSYTSNKQPFVVLDMFNLRSITVDVKTEVAVVEAGALMGELYYRIFEKSKAHGFPASVCPSVGAGGHISGGGYGNMLRKHGLSVDNVIDAKIVDVKGNIMDRKAMGEDLFWAIRGGGGGSFGVILSYTVKIVPVPETVTFFRVDRTLLENGTDLVIQWQQVAPTTDDRLFMRLLMGPGDKTVRVSVVALFLGGADEVVSILAKEFPLLGLKKENCTEARWIDSVIWWNDAKAYEKGAKPEVLLERRLNDAIYIKRASDYVQTAIPREGLELIWKKLIELGKPGLVFNPYGGKMDTIPSDATAFPHRKGNLFKIQYSVNWNDPSPDVAKKLVDQIKSLHTFMTPYVSKNPRSAFLNYRDIDIGTNSFGKNSVQEGEVYGTAYFNANYQRLVKIKTQVDPDNFFRNEQSIPVLPSKALGTKK